MLNGLFFASICILQLQSTVALWREFEFIGIENSKAGILRTDFRVSRQNKAFQIQGSFNIMEDINDDYDAEVKLYQSLKGSSQYTLLPYKVLKEAVCKLMTKVPWCGVQKDLEKVSDLPKKQAGEELCRSYKKNTYTIREYEFGTNVIPKHFDPATYKADILIYKRGSDEVDSKLCFMVKLY